MKSCHIRNLRVPPVRAARSGYRQDMNRILRILSRGSSGGNRGRGRKSNRPRGEGMGLVDSAKRLFRRR